MKNKKNYFLLSILGGLMLTLVFFAAMGELWFENGDYLSPVNSSQGVNVSANAYAWVNGSRICTESNSLCAMDADGSGTAGNIPLWFNSTRLTDSNIVQDDLNTKYVFGYGVLDVPSPLSIGFGAVSGNLGDSIGSGSIGINPGDLAIGGGSLASGVSSTAIGYAADSSGFSSISLGSGSKANGSRSTAIATNSLSSGLRSTAIGFNARSDGADSVAIGGYASCYGTNSLCLVRNSSAYGSDSIAIGYRATAADVRAVAIGTESYAEYNSFAFGYRTAARGNNTIVISSDSMDVTGTNVVSIGNTNGLLDTSDSVSIGYAAVAGRGAIGIGYQAMGSNNGTALGSFAEAGTSSTQERNVAVGFSARAATVQEGLGYPGIDNVAVGSYADTRSGENNTAIGASSFINGNNSLAIGTKAAVALSSQGGIAIGYNSYSMLYCMGMGFNANCSNIYGVAIGWNSTMLFNQGTAIGALSKVVNTGATAIGYNSLAGGSSSTSIGALSYSSNIAGVAIGNSANSSGIRAIAIGQTAKASIGGSIAIGQATNASGVGSVAIGQTANSNMTGAIAIGRAASANGTDSVALGTNTYTNASNAYAFGKGCFNDMENTALFCNITIVTTGGLLLNDSGMVWDDVLTPATALSKLGSRDPSMTGWDSSAGLRGVYLPEFSDEAVNERELGGSIQLPHQYWQGSNIVPHIHFGTHTNRTCDSVWGFEYQWANINDLMPGSKVIYATHSFGANDAYKDVMLSWGNISGSGKTISSIVNFRLWRNSSSSLDTCNGDSMWLMSFDTHYMKDSLGSRQEAIK